jgi:hypothetical protein
MRGGGICKVALGSAAVIDSNNAAPSSRQNIKESSS